MRFFATTLHGDGTETTLIPDLPLADWSVVVPLGAQEIRGAVNPESPVVFGPDGRLLVQAWATAIYAVHAGRIVAAGIVTTATAADHALNITAAGFGAYPVGMPWTGPTQTLYNVDPAAVIKTIWDHLQSQPGGNLGVTVPVLATGRTVGAQGTVTRSPGDPGTVIDEPVILAPWDTPDLGKVIDEMTAAGRIDWVEEHALVGKTITHRLNLATRLGSVRRDLRFRFGENVTAVDATTTDTDWACEVLVIAGEGPTASIGTATTTPTRVRRVATVKAGSSTGYVAANASAASILAEYASGAGGGTVDRVTVLDRDAAPHHSWSPGDTILITAPPGPAGPVSAWCRVIATTYTATTAVIDVVPADRKPLARLVRSDGG